jgi:hypothetical protein
VFRTRPSASPPLMSDPAGAPRISPGGSSVRAHRP